MAKFPTFDRNYFIVALALFFVEVGIALFVKDKFVRPYVGDFLVVIFIYCFVKSFWDESPLRIGIYVLLFAFAIEFGQYFQLVKLLGLHEYKWARIIIGTGFDWGDLLAYILGVLTVLGVEKYFLKNAS